MFQDAGQEGKWVPQIFKYGMSQFLEDVFWPENNFLGLSFRKSRVFWPFSDLNRTFHQLN